MAFYKLTIDLIPRTSWYNNVRERVTTDQWDIIRKKCYKIAEYKCQICGDTGLNQGFTHPVECHEVWVFDDKNDTQILKDFIALCPLCHKTKHYGLAKINNEEEKVLSHLMRINNIGIRTAKRYVETCFSIWKNRNKKNWIVDVNYINKYIKF